jgi:Mlc titration factor MtfA (ptsG expression regulator)
MEEERRPEEALERDPEAKSLGTHWERRTVRTAWILSVASIVPFFLVAAALRPAHLSPWTMAPLAIIGGVGVFLATTRKMHRRRVIMSRPFPAEWEAVLQRDVLFFRTLEPAEQRRFRRQLQVFLGEKRVTGIGTQLDTTTQVLAGASAIIPIFGFPEWEWEQISEVLIYPSRFDQDFSFEKGEGKNTLGMVGTGVMSRLMILAKPDLLHGFRDAGDKHNVGLHEFAHLVDKSDGAVDGLPAVGLDRRSVGPWIELVRRKMEEIDRGESDIDPYALTNEAEFFAVASEYFFERPGVMKKKHPALYEMLERVFRQNLSSRISAFATERQRGRQRFGRNSPCPCGSGRKYKKCCLKSGR